MLRVKSDYALYASEAIPNEGLSLGHKQIFSIRIQSLENQGSSSMVRRAQHATPRTKRERKNPRLVFSLTFFKIAPMA